MGTLYILQKSAPASKMKQFDHFFVFQNWNFSESSAAPEGSPPPTQQTNIRMLNSWVAPSTRFSQMGEEKPGNMSDQSEHICTRFPEENVYDDENLLDLVYGHSLLCLPPFLPDKLSFFRRRLSIIANVPKTIQIVQRPFCPAKFSWSIFANKERKIARLCKWRY